MKKFVIIAGMALVVLTIAGTVLAATTNVAVSANIVGTCQFNSTPALGFGQLDQTSSADATASGSLVFWCTTGTAYTLGDETNPGTGDGAFSGTMVDGGNSIPYSITYNSFTGSGTGKTTPITSTLNATIVNAQYVDKPEGNYSDTVTFTIAP